MTYLAFDILGEVAFGRDIKCVEKGCDAEGLKKGFKAGLFAFGVATRMHVAAEWVNWSWIGRFLEWQVPRDTTIGVLMRFGRKVLKERLCETGNPKMEKHNDMLQRYEHFRKHVLRGTDRIRLLDSRCPEGEPMDLGSFLAELTTTLLAGADTISTTACTTIIYILQSPPALAKIISEYKSAQSLGLLSPIPQQAEVLEHCPYYVACLKESMRVCPSVRSIFP